MTELVLFSLLTILMCIWLYLCPKTTWHTPVGFGALLLLTVLSCVVFELTYSWAIAGMLCALLGGSCGAVVENNRQKVLNVKLSKITGADVVRTVARDLERALEPLMTNARVTGIDTGEEESRSVEVLIFRDSKLNRRVVEVTAENLQRLIHDLIESKTILNTVEYQGKTVEELKAILAGLSFLQTTVVEKTAPEVNPFL